MITKRNIVKKISLNEYAAMLKAENCPDCKGDLVLYHPSNRLGCPKCGIVYEMEHTNRPKRLVRKAYSFKRHSYK